MSIYSLSLTFRDSVFKHSQCSTSCILSVARFFMPKRLVAKPKKGFDRFYVVAILGLVVALQEKFNEIIDYQ